MSKKSRTRGILLLLGLIIIVVVATQSFTLLGEEVLLPKYLTGKCVPRIENLNLQTIVSHTDSPQWYHCNSGESKTWIPHRSQCDYSITLADAATIYICDGYTENENDLDTEKCEKITGRFSAGESELPNPVISGDTIYINTDRIFGSAVVKVRYPSYGLEVRQGDLFVSPTTESCELTSLSREYHTVGAKNLQVVEPDIPFNVISGTQRAASSQLVLLSDVENGAAIYITRVAEGGGYYSLVKESDDGTKYVDIEGGEFFSTKIECIPGFSCTNDAKLIALEEQSCSGQSGIPVGFAPVKGKVGTLCTYACIDGTPSPDFDNCITIPESCPSNKPLFDVDTGQCIALDEMSESDKDDNFLLIMVIAIATFVIVMAIIITRQQGKKTGGLFL